MPIVKPLLYQNGGPILMVQIENEYGDFSCDHEYTAFLRDYTRGLLGNDSVLYTSEWEFSEIALIFSLGNRLKNIDFAPRKGFFHDGV
jgi:beta-galactosidase